MPTTISAAVLRSPHGPFSIEPLILDDPRAGEVLVRIVGAGLCHTDLLDRERPAGSFPSPIVNGHEGAGIVKAVGEGVTQVKAGDRVVLSFASCASCKPCAVHKPSYCDRFLELNVAGGRADGSTALHTPAGEAIRSHFFAQSSFASHAIALERNVVKIPDGLPLEIAGPLGCGVQTGAGAVMNSLMVPKGASLVVFGAGSVGLSAILAGVVVGASPIIAVDIHASRLEMAMSLGATQTIDATKEDVLGQIREATGGGTDFALDTTGNVGVIRTAWDCLNRIGSLGIAGVGYADISFNQIEFMTGRTIRGILEGDSDPARFIPELAELYLEGRFPFDKLITPFPLEAINEAEKLTKSGEVIKPVFTFV
jgi:aryl-alcohol dehydrogenase